MQSGVWTQAGYTAPLCAHMASSLGTPFGRRDISPTQAAGSDARLCALWELLSHWKTWTWLWKVHCGVSRLRGMGCMTSCRRSFPPRSYDLMWLSPKHTVNSQLSTVGGRSSVLLCSKILSIGLQVPMHRAHAHHSPGEAGHGHKLTPGLKPTNGLCPVWVPQAACAVDNLCVLVNHNDGPSGSVGSVSCQHCPAPGLTLQ